MEKKWIFISNLFFFPFLLQSCCGVLYYWFRFSYLLIVVFTMRYLTGRKVASRREDLRELIEHFNVSFLLKILSFSTKIVIISLLMHAMFSAYSQLMTFFIGFSAIYFISPMDHTYVKILSFITWIIDAQWSGADWLLVGCHVCHFICNNVFLINGTFGIVHLTWMMFLIVDIWCDPDL